MNRLVLVTVCWFIFWTMVGWTVGRVLDIPGTFTIMGFLFALVSVFSWPFIFPSRFQDWMYD